MLNKLLSLRHHAGFMRYFSNTSWLFAEKVLRMIVAVFVGIWIARYLGPEQFGLLSYAQSFVGLFAAIATLGLDGIVVRELVKDESRRSLLIGTAFWLKIIGSALVLGILTIAALFSHNDTLTNALIFIIASSTVFQAFNVVDFYFQAKVLSRYVVFANAFSLLISSAIKIILIVYEAPLIAFAWSALFDSFILASGFIYYFIKKAEFSIKQWTFHKATAITLLKDSWSLVLSGIVISIYMKIDQVMIMEMMDAEAVGQYAAAVRISEAWYFIPMVVVSSLFPAIINAKKQSEELYYARLQKLYDLMIWMSIAIAFPMTFLSDWVIHFLYGEQYDQAESVLMIHIWAGFNVALGTAWSKWMLTQNKQNIVLYGHILGVVLNILLNLYFIKYNGINGAAVATLLSYWVSALFVYSLYKPMIAYKMFFNSFNIFRIAYLNSKN